MNSTFRTKYNRKEYKDIQYFEKQRNNSFTTNFDFLVFYFIAITKTISRR